MDEVWRSSFRRGFAPSLSTAGLLALCRALAEKDPRLCQGSTARPMGNWGDVATLDCPVESACAISLCGWLGDGLNTVGEVINFFGDVCLAVDKALGCPGDCRWFLEWFDNENIETIRRELIPEITQELERREVHPDVVVRIAE